MCYDKVVPFSQVDQYLQAGFAASGICPSLTQAFRHFLATGEWVRGDESSLAHPDPMHMDDAAFVQYMDSIPVLLASPDNMHNAPKYEDLVPVRAGSYVLRHFNFGDTAMHMHDYIEVCYVYRGSCTQTVCGCEVMLSEGDFLFLPGNVIHGVSVADKSSLVLNILINREMIHTITYSILSGRSPFHMYFQDILLEKHSNVLRIKTESDARIKRIVRQLAISSYENMDDPLCDQTSGVLISLLNMLHRHEQHELILLERQVSADRFFDILNYIGQHYSTVTLAQAAEKFHYSPCYLSRLVKNATGATFTENLTRIRIRAAIELLEQTNLPMHRICEEVGYFDVTHFIRSFKKICGTTPYAFRKQQRVQRGEAMEA